MDLSEPERIHFFNELRYARQQVLRDAEAVDSVIFAVEKLGRFVSGRQAGLAKYRPSLSKVAEASTFHHELPNHLPQFHIPFNRLFDSLIECRNDAMHQGVYARTLATHAVQLALILEDALLTKVMKISDLMVRNPVCAETWQPLSFIRQTMLTESFSHLPVFWNKQWWLISDAALANYLRRGGTNLSRDQKLARRLLDVLEQKELQPTTPKFVRPTKSLSEVAGEDLTVPALVVDGTMDEAGRERLWGIVTAYDLL